MEDRRRNLPEACLDARDLTGAGGPAGRPGAPEPNEVYTFSAGAGQLT